MTDRVLESIRDGEYSEGIPEITLSYADFTTLDDLTTGAAQDNTYSQTSVRLMMAQTPGVEGAGRGGGARPSKGSPVNREKRKMKAEKLVQYAERGARNLTEHQHNQVSFNVPASWFPILKNPDFATRNPDFLLKNV